MKTFITKKHINTGFVIGLLILLTINVLTYLNTSRHLSDEGTTGTALKIISYSDALVYKAADAESDRRGYLLTESGQFLMKYDRSINEIDTIFGNIKILASDNPKLKPAIDSLGILLSDRTDPIKELSDVRENKLTSPGELTGLLNRSIQRQERIKFVVSEIQREEREFINRLNAENKASSKYILIQIIIGSMIGFIVLITGLVILNKNLTRRAESEKALEENMNWFSTTLKSIGDGVIVTNHLGDITFMNPVAQNLTGWREDEAKGIYLEHVYNLISEDTKERIENPVRTVFKKGELVSHSGKTLLLNKDGMEIPIDLSASPIVSNGRSLDGVVLVFRDMSERRKAEREILRNQKFIQRISESIPNILYVYNVTDSKLIYINKQIKELLGYLPEDVLNREGGFLKDYIHPDDFEAVSDKYKKFNESSDTHVLESEYRIRNSSGDWRWLRSYDVIFSRNDEGLPFQILGTALDITEKKHLEEQIRRYSQHLEEVVERRTSELRLTNERLQEEIIDRINAEKNISEAEEKFRSLVEYSLVGIYIIQDGCFVYVNPKLEEIFGYNHNELTGVNLLDVVESEYMNAVNENTSKILKNEKSDTQYSFKAIRKNGRLIDVDVRGTRMKYKGKMAIIGTLQDITERKEAEDALREQEEYLRTVINSAPNIIYVKDWEGKFKLVNGAASEYYSMKPSEILGKTEAELGKEKDIQKIIEEDREVMNTFEPLIIPEEKFEDEKTGNEKWMQIIKVPLKVKDEKKQVLCILTDITARKMAEENIRTSLKEKELLLQEIHHRVKNNLQIIVSLLKLQSRYISDKRDLEIFNKSRARVETMALIHEKLYRSANLENIHVGNYLCDLTSQILKAYGADSTKVNLEVKSDDVRVGIDTAIPCGLIVNELVSNSLKHAFRINQKGSIEINVNREDCNITLNFKDNGVGLPKHFSLEETKSLGLQLVSTLVKQLDGTIDIDSSSNGITYKMRFPEVVYKNRVNTD